MPHLICNLYSKFCGGNILTIFPWVNLLGGGSSITGGVVAVSGDSGVNVFSGSFLICE